MPRCTRRPVTSQHFRAMACFSRESIMGGRGFWPLPLRADADAEVFIAVGRLLSSRVMRIRIFCRHADARREGGADRTIRQRGPPLHKPFASFLIAAQPVYDCSPKVASFPPRVVRLRRTESTIPIFDTHCRRARAVAPSIRRHRLQLLVVRFADESACARRAKQWCHHQQHEPFEHDIHTPTTA